MRNGEDQITPEDLIDAAGVRSDGDAGLMIAAADEIERLRRLVSELGQEVNLDRCVFDDIRIDVQACIIKKEAD